MNLDEYQTKAKSTIQQYRSEDQKHFTIGYLGLAGEAGSVLTTLKKALRDSESSDRLKDNLKEELGDVLWYVASIASHYGLSLNEIAEFNLDKTSDRFKEFDLLSIPRFDEKYEARFPDSFIVNFVEEHSGHFPTVKMLWEKEDCIIEELGDALTDNSRMPNDYRYHDVFHLGYIAYLGWSPVLRHLMGLKRKEDLITLDGEDRGRPQVAEEAVTFIIYNYAKRSEMLRNGERIDTELLKMIKQLVSDLEVSVVSAFHWETTIRESFRVFHEIVANSGGRVLVSPSTRELRYLGK